eukprot:7474829-Pyramimonas_sp.AAC.1
MHVQFYSQHHPNVELTSRPFFGAATSIFGNPPPCLWARSGRILRSWVWVSVLSSGGNVSGADRAAERGMRRGTRRGRGS